MKKNIVAVACMAMAVLAAYGGVSYTMQVSSEGDGGGGGRPGGKMMIKGMMEGEDIRLEFHGQPSPVMPGHGGYMLIKEAGTRTYMVNPESKTYFAMNSMDMANAAGAMMGMKVSDVSVKKVLDEDGGKILGYPVRHIKIHTSYTMEMTVMGNKMNTSVVQEDEIWATTGIQFPNIERWMKSLTGSFGAELKKIAEAQKGYIKGFPLKMVVTSTSKNPMGQTQTSKSVMEVTEFVEKNISADMFAIPAGYKEQTMPNIFGPRTGAGLPDDNGVTD